MRKEITSITIHSRNSFIYGHSKRNFYSMREIEVWTELNVYPSIFPEKNNTLDQWLQFHLDVYRSTPKKGRYVLRKHLSYGLPRLRFWGALRSSDNYSNRYGWVNLFQQLLVEPECIRSIHAHFFYSLSFIVHRNAYTQENYLLTFLFT